MKIAILTTDNREHLKDYSNPNPHFGNAPTALLEGFSQLDNVEVHVVSCIRQAIKSPGKLAHNIWFHPLVVPKIGWLSSGYSGCICAVRKKLEEINPDIVHGQGTERDCAISAVLSGYPNVLTIHGNMAEVNRLFPSSKPSLRLYQWLVSRLEDYCLKRTSIVFCNSAYTESLVRSRTSRTVRVPNPIRSKFFQSFISAKSLPFSLPIINVGAIAPRKRQLELLKMAEVLHQEGVIAPFLFIGARSGDTYSAAFDEHLAKAEKAGYAFYLGTKQTEELISIMDQAGAMVHFPLEESFGLVVAEALARNLKFFGSSLGGIVDIAGDIEGAELFSSNNWDLLKQNVKDWIEKGRPRPTTAANEMSLRYHPRTVAQLHLDIYRGVLNSSS